MPALDGLKVIDLTRILAGPYCTQALADHGADVLKIEAPAGDDTRKWGPPFVGEDAAYFVGVNRGKRNEVLDLGSAAGQGRLRALLADADVLVENFRADTMAGWGLDYARDLAPLFPSLIHCRITGFGDLGPLGGQPGYDAGAQAITGLMSLNGDPAGVPTRIGVPVVDLVTGLNALSGILMALQERQRSGRGQSIDIALYDCGISLLHPQLANYLASGNAPERTGNAHPNICPYDSFPTATQDIFLTIGNDGQFQRLCAHLGLDGLASDPRFTSNSDRLAHRTALSDALSAALADQDGAQLAESLNAAGVPCAPVLSVPDVVEHPHTKARQMIVRIGDYAGCASPIKLSRTPARYAMRPPARHAPRNDGNSGKA